MSYEYIERFKKLGFGMFVHFGLYSVLGKGEWYLRTEKISTDEYQNLASKFDVSPDWAQKLVSMAKNAGCKYITLTTRHHDGFSLYDTCGLNDYDAPHSACKRDLIAEFVNECNAQGIIPFFYHTLADWRNTDYNDNFPKYMDYLIESIKILCTNYGKIGGLWFDGMWDKPEENWQEDRLYGTIRSLQPQAMIINNTGLDNAGKTGHKEIDSVTFERSKPCQVVVDGKPIAGEVCETTTEHWGYCQNDICTKSPKELLDCLIDARASGCNFLLNVGPNGKGYVRPAEEEIFRCIGIWIDANKDFIYNCVPSSITATNAQIVTDGVYHYAIIKNVPMCFNINIARARTPQRIVLDTNLKASNAIWLDNGEPIEILPDGSFYDWHFSYGTSLHARVARFELKK